MDNNVKALNELSKGASMGMDAVKYILEYAIDDGLKNFLDHNYKKYETLSDSIERVYSKYQKDEPQPTVTPKKRWLCTFGRAVVIPCRKSIFRACS